ncbi:MAG: hypothetical protein PPFGHCPK_01261 [Spiroplasma endosymbiont of Drosophila atripex]|nr:MAG: hypothetical protein PPFGHCPK_01261 [Spiroplasma endosymbiont of Drosophila atripex]
MNFFKNSDKELINFLRSQKELEIKLKITEEERYLNNLQHTKEIVNNSLMELKRVVINVQYWEIDDFCYQEIQRAKLFLSNQKIKSNDVQNNNENQPSTSSYSQHNHSTETTSLLQEQIYSINNDQIHTHEQNKCCSPCTIL